ncbi:MAG: hypothetical protein AAF800_02105 [Planctomycetota bacterium]
MKQSARTWTVVALVCVIGVAASPADAQPFDSPEAVFAEAQTAFNQRDWAGFVGLVSPARRDELIGQMAVTFAFMAQQPGADPRVGAMVDAYLPRDVDPMDLMMTSDDPAAETIRLAKRIGRPQAFFAEAMEVAFALEHPDPDRAPRITEMNKVALDEEAQTAIGTITLEAPAPPAEAADAESPDADGLVTREDTWSFARHEGSWYLTMR